MNTSRNGLSALAAVVAIALLFVLLATCQGGNELDAPPDDISGEFEERPELKPQPKIEIEAGTPDMLLAGQWSSDAALEAWEQTAELARDWTLNPKFVLEHDAELDELDKITKLMTEDAAATWLKQSHRAIEPWVDRFRTHDRRPKAEAELYKLIQWNQYPPRYRGYDNPFFGTGVADGIVLGAPGQLGVIMRIKTSFHYMGQGKEYVVPYTTTLFVRYARVDGAWKMTVWDRAAAKGTEREITAEATPEPSELPTEGLEPDPILGGDITPGTVFPS